MIQKEGPGWRVVRNPSRGNFSTLIGGENWAIEITENEWTSLVSFVFDLVDQHSQLKNQLMPEEECSLELERQPWWGCLDGDRSSWSLQLILEGDESLNRGAELFWPSPAAEAFVEALRIIWDS